MGGHLPQDCKLWSAEEHDRLIELASFGLETPEIAPLLGRTEGAISVRCAEFGISTQGGRDAEMCVRRRLRHARLHPSGWSRPAMQEAS